MMNEEKFKVPVAKPTEEVVAAIRRNTAYSLPDDPSAAGISAATIRKRFWSAICGADASVLSELLRVIEEINGRFDSFIDALSGIDESGELTDGVASLMMTGLEEGYSLQDLFRGLSDGSAMQLIKAGIEEYTIKGYMLFLKEQLANKFEKSEAESWKDEIDSELDSMETDTNQKIDGLDSELIKLKSETNGKISENEISIQKNREELVSMLEELERRTNSAINFIKDGTTTKEIDSIKELVDYVNEHGNTTIQMQQNISQNTQIIEAIDEKSRQLEASLAANEAADAELKKKVEQDINQRFDTFAGALKGEACGVAVFPDDISPVPHTIDCRVYGKNLIPYPYYEIQNENLIPYPYRDGKNNVVTNRENNGVSYIVRDDGGIEVSGATGNKISGFDLYLGNMNLIAGTYTVDGHTNGVSIAVRQLVDGVEKSFNYEGKDTVTMTEPFVINRISLHVPANTTIPDGTVIYPNFRRTGIIRKGISYIVQDDGGVSVEGTATDTVELQIFSGKMELPAGTYYLSGGDTNAGPLVRYLKSGVETHFANMTQQRRVMAEPFTVCRIAIRVEKGETVPKGTVVYPMLEMADAASEYVQYVSPSEMRVYTVGKNLFDDGTLKNGYYNSADFSLTNTSSSEHRSLRIRLSAGTYTISCNGVEFQVLRVIKDGAFDGSAKTAGNKYTFTVSGAGEVGISVRRPSTGWGDTKVQIECGATATEYEPYVGAEYTPEADGGVKGLTGPYIRMMAEYPARMIWMRYNRDINTALAKIEQAIIALGGNVNV